MKGRHKHEGRVDFFLSLALVMMATAIKRIEISVGLCLDV